MHLHTRWFWAVTALTMLTFISLTINISYSESDPIIDIAPVYIPFISNTAAEFLPPPLEAGQEGWLRKWRESQDLDPCLQLSGTYFYLEPEPGAPERSAAILPTTSVPEVALEVHIDEKVLITGRMEYFDTSCGFPRLYAEHLEVIEVSPEGPTRY